MTVDESAPHAEGDTVKKFALVVDLGGTKIAAACVDSFGNLTHQVLTPTPRIGGKAIVSAIIETLEKFPIKNVCAIGVDVPGLAYADGCVWAPNLHGWKHMPLGAMLREYFHLPVLIESDRNAFVTGEAWIGAARGCRDVIFLAIGTGIGAGIISGGELLRGSGELSGSLGWMAIGPHFLPEYKSVGCLETHLAGPGIAKNATRVRKTPTTVAELIGLARQGDATAIKLMTEAGDFLGIALANLVSILNPERIVVGGGVAAAGNLLLTPARQAMMRWAQPLAAKQVRVVRSRLGERAALLGMAKLTFDKAT
jgi:glucokinase